MLFLAVLPAYCQVEKAKETFPNGQLKYKGKYLKCTTLESRNPYILNYEKRQIGEWIYYYPSGVVSEIRNYTKRVRDCNIKILKEGEWKYFNEEGVLYRKEKYYRDTLVYAETEIFEHSSLIGKIVLSKESADTVFYLSNEEKSNLIPNPSFDQYFYKPVTIVNEGRNQIEELIPFWYSPDGATPDYYNQYRMIADVPEHFEVTQEATTQNGYIGLMLFRGRKRAVKGTLLTHKDQEPEYSNDYSESIQTKLVHRLKKGRYYCFKAKLALSRNAGYQIDRFDVLFSESPLKFSYEHPPESPSLSFSITTAVPQNWNLLCRAFIASDDEAFITLGRFSTKKHVSAFPQTPENQSSLDINRSAYYLLDDLQLYEVDSLTACGCEPLEEMPRFPAYSTFEEIRNEEIIEGKRFILSTIRFDFDKSKIKDSFIPELERLLNYLESHPLAQIHIFGHTDDSGTEPYNQKLSRERAEKIKDWLLNKGIEESRIRYDGLGSKFPLAENASEENQIINRRVEFEILNE